MKKGINIAWINSFQISIWSCATSKVYFDLCFTPIYSVHGEVSGVKFTEDTILTTTGEQVIDGNKILQCDADPCELTVNNLDVLFLNDQNLDELLNQAVSIHLNLKRIKISLAWREFTLSLKFLNLLIFEARLP